MGLFRCTTGRIPSRPRLAEPFGASLGNANCTQSHIPLDVFAYAIARLIRDSPSCANIPSDLGFYTKR
jgi:hypothetical protein